MITGIPMLEVDKLTPVPTLVEVNAPQVDHDSQQSGASKTSDEQVLQGAVNQLVEEASGSESKAIELDRAGQVSDAILSYQQAADKFKQAVTICPDELLENKTLLSRRVGDILGRVVYLESLGGCPASVPVEEHVRSAQNDVQTGGNNDGCITTLTDTVQSTAAENRPSLAKRAASAAAVTGGAAVLILHAPVAAAALAVGAAYATTRNDSAGAAASSVGEAGIKAANRAKTFAETHGITEKVSGALDKVVSAESREQMTNQAQSAASDSWNKIRELNEKHQLSRKTQAMASSSFKAASQTASSATSQMSSWFKRNMKS